MILCSVVVSCMVGLQDSLYIGCDLSGSQLSRAVDNVCKAAAFNVLLLEGDGTSI